MEAFYAGSCMWKLDSGQTRAQEKTAGLQIGAEAGDRSSISCLFLDRLKGRSVLCRRYEVGCDGAVGVLHRMARRRTSSEGKVAPCSVAT